MPARYTYLAGEDQCRKALAILDQALGPHLIKRYGGGTRIADVDELFQAGEAELAFADDDAIEAIAAAMVALATTLQDALSLVTADENASPDLRQIAQQVTPASDVLWSHYGGDSGGW